MSSLPVCARQSGAHFLGCDAGPEAAAYLQGMTAFDLKTLTFGKSAFVPLEGFNVHVARGGYTGEDGFEVRSLFAAIAHI